jgi:hypothetical protein
VIARCEEESLSTPSYSAKPASATTTGDILPTAAWEVRAQDWRGAVEHHQLRFGKRRTPPVKKTRFATEAEARTHADLVRAQNAHHPDVLIAVVQLGRPVAAPTPAFDGAQDYPWRAARVLTA